jgi:predicted GTPase
LAGKLYPEGIPICAESELPELIKELKVDQVVLSYSDLSYAEVMSKAALVNAWGASFTMLGAQQTMLESDKPVIAVCAVRTGVGKSQTTRKIVDILRAKGLRVVVVRHPMPYGDLAKQAVQRFASYEDLDLHKTTIEEREEYEPHIDRGIIVYAGVDYEAILREAEKEADVILWDGGNNDTPFFKPDLHITLVDPHRPGDEAAYYPGEVNVLLADVIVINKIDSASPEGIATVRDNVMRLNPDAMIIEAASPITIDEPEVVKGKQILVVEDGPTLTHGGMSFGAGVVAARKLGVAFVDPRPYAVESIASTFATYDHLAEVLPAMGYGEKQVQDLEETIKRVPCDAVLIATPIDLRRVVNIDQPSTRVRYELQEIGQPTLEEALKLLKL